MNLINMFKTFVERQLEKEEPMQQEDNQDIVVTELTEKGVRAVGRKCKEDGLINNEVELRFAFNDIEIVGSNILYRCNIIYMDSEEDKARDNFVRKINFNRNSIEVLADIDFRQFNSNPEYRMAFMNKVLEEKRVQKILEEGLKENPTRPCGNYIGTISRDAKGEYKKYFDLEIGEMVHRSEKMREKRRELGIENKEKETETEQPKIIALTGNVER